jgi:hypothetical protein
MWGVTSFGDELTGDFCDGFEAISIGDFGLFYRLAGKIVSRILGLLQQYRPISAATILRVCVRYRRSCCRAVYAVGEAVHDPKTNRQSRNDRFRAEKFGFRSMARWNC